MRRRVTRFIAPITMLLAVPSCAERHAGAAGDLLGDTFDRVVERFGVPDDWVIAADAVVITYVGADGGTGRFVFHDDVAVSVPATGFAPRRITPPRSDRAWPGQRLADAVARLGNPIRYSLSSTTTFEYADGTTMVAAGGRAFVRRVGD